MGQNLPADWSVKACAYVLLWYGAVSWWCINWGIVLRKRDEYRVARGEEPKPLKPAGVPVYADGKPLGMMEYKQITQAVAFDAERNFARSLIDMRNGNLEVVMTEAYWIKGGKYGDSREAFVTMLDKWRYHKVAGRAGNRQNSTYEVRDWKQVRMIAGGLKLTAPPL